MKTKEEIFNELKDVFRGELGIIRVDHKTSFTLETDLRSDLLVDSLDMCFIINAVDDRFEVSLSNADIEAMGKNITVSKFIDVIYEKMNNHK